MAFATWQHLVLQYTPKRIGELATSTTSPVAEADFDTDDVIEWALERATEEILMSVRQGDKYSEADLQTLANSATAGWSLRGLCVDIAYALLQMRKGVRTSDIDQLCPGYRMAMQTLAVLASGVEVFPRITGEEHADAGTPRTARLTEQTTSPTIHESWSAQATSRLVPNSPLNGPNGYHTA